MSPFARDALASINFGLLHRLEHAHQQRDALTAEVRRISRDKAGYLARLPASIRAEHEKRWREIERLNARADLHSRYEAGEATAHLICEWLVLIAMIMAVSEAALEVAIAALRLVQVARRIILRGRPVDPWITKYTEAIPLAGRDVARAGAREAEAAPASAAPAEAPKPVEAPARRPRDTLKVSQVDHDLAAQEGASPAHEVARRRVARAFYDEYTTFPEATKQSHLAAIDYSKPLQAGPPPPCPTAQYQWRTPGTLGQYYGDFQSPPTGLGIHHHGQLPSGEVVPKEYVQFRVPEDAPYLQSTSAPAMDTWSIPSEAAKPTTGGSTQRFIPYQTAKGMQDLGKVRSYGGPL